MLELYISGDNREKPRRSFRDLRTKISLIDKECRTIAVTSNDAEKYRAQITANLALCMTDIGKRCLMILADPKGIYEIVPYREGAGRFGVSECLSGSGDYKKCIQKTQFDNLDVIIAGSGRNSSTELLEGERFKALLVSLKEEYDQVFVDLPAVNKDLGSIVIAGYCDAGLLVLPGTVRLRSIRETVRLLSENSHLLGVIRVRKNSITEKQAVKDHR